MPRWLGSFRQVWHRSLVRWVAAGLLVMTVVGTLFAPGLYHALAALQPGAGPHTNGRGTLRVDAKAAAQWYRQLHIGARGPAAGVRSQALRQASRMPHVRIGGSTPSSAATSAQATTISPRTLAPAHWSALGPAANQEPGFGQFSGEVTAIAVDPSDATGHTVWIGTAASGVWLTTNGGSTWTPMTDSPAQISPAIGALAIDGNTTPSTIYAGTGDPNTAFGGAYAGTGLWKSTDSGATWSQLGSFSGLSIARIAIVPTSPVTLLIATGWDGVS